MDQHRLMKAGDLGSKGILNKALQVGWCRGRVLLWVRSLQCVPSRPCIKGAHSFSHMQQAYYATGITPSAVRMMAISGYGSVMLLTHVQPCRFFPDKQQLALLHMQTASGFWACRGGCGSGDSGHSLVECTHLQSAAICLKWPMPPLAKHYG